MRIFILSNQQIVTSVQDDSICWAANNGENKPTLKLINPNRPIILPSDEYLVGSHFAYTYDDVNIRQFIGGKVRYFFINEDANNKEFCLGVVLNRGAYGADVLTSSKVIEEYTSIGGTANSRSSMHLVQLGAFVRVNTFKGIATPEYFVLSRTGWQLSSEHEDTSDS